MKLSEWRAAAKLPPHETDQIIERVFGLDRLHIITDSAATELSEETVCLLRKMCDRRASGEPLQYILQYAYFMGLKFAVNPHVLIPRPDTEILVSESVKCIQECRQTGYAPRSVLDLCTGSGCVGISILSELLPSADFDLTMSDLSRNALSVAKQNFDALVSKQWARSAEFLLSDYFAAFAGRKFDIIVSNPPYIRAEEIQRLDAEVYAYEPHMALDGGKDGLCAYRMIAGQAPCHLNTGGHILLEVGYDQAEEVAALFSKHFQHTEIIQDLNGWGRVVHAF